MSFQEEMKNAFVLSHSPEALEHREEPDGHDYSGAGAYLSHIKESIRGQLRSAPDAHAEGHVILGTLPLEDGPSVPEDFVLVDHEHQEPGLFKQFIGAYLTRRGYVLIRDLKELAAQEGISLTFDLSYQGIHTPLDGNGVGARYQLPHTNRLTETVPKVWVRYDYRVEDVPEADG